MPIRLNLMAEMQAVDETRRKDHVKRAILVGVVLVIAMLVWSSMLMVKQMAARSELSSADGDIYSQTNSFSGVLDHEKRLADEKARLRDLQTLAAGRGRGGGRRD